MAGSGSDSIQVAVRVRPLLPIEVNSSCKDCISIFPSVSQVKIKGSDEAFTYNHVFGSTQTQEHLYNVAVKPLVPQLFKGYNVTVLAYGQTGSGKTHSMGTCSSTETDDNAGIIPRSVAEIFDCVEKSTNCDYTISVSFLELYQEQIRDLLRNSQATLEVREDASGNVLVPGLTQVSVNSHQDTMACLVQGSLLRTTGATAMNRTSSRSHAVFTIKIERMPKDGEQATISKFCLVDLAGSERAKKTQAIGERFKEGVNINMGLLALGNVISALGDESQKKSHIPYRDSKLTRLLQDSLGGNSFTLMIACVSPADRNINETLNTLRYADRARKIKNKPIVNADPKSAEIGQLRGQVTQLQQLLAHERTKTFRKCPAAHQRLVELVKDLVSDDATLTFRTELQSNTSPRTKTLLRQVGITLAEEIEDDDSNSNSNPTSLFPCIEGLQDSDIEEEVNEDEQVQEETDYENFQAKLDSELQDVERKLQQKEILAAQLVSSSSFEDASEEKMHQLQQQIDILIKEKAELATTLEHLQKHNNKASAQLAEQRRKQIRELEQKLIEQRKKHADYSRIVQARKQAENKIKNLNTEIQDLKQTKVRLAREIKKSADNFRSWKQRQDKEVGRLQEAERRGRNQLDRQNKLHVKQQQVLQRRFQEAMAANKRMREALALQRRPINGTLANSNNLQQTMLVTVPTDSDQFSTWMDHEIEVERSLNLTRDTLEQLMMVKAKMQSQMDKIKQETKCWEDRNTRNKKAKDRKKLEAEIRHKESQITELDRKLLDIEFATSKSPGMRWRGITSLSDSRSIMSHMFEKVVSLDMLLNSEKEKRLQIQATNTELTQQLKQLQEELQEKEKEIEASKPSPTIMTTPKHLTLSNVSNSTQEVLQPLTSIMKQGKKSFFPALYEDEEEFTFENSYDEVDRPDMDPDWKQTPLVMRERQARKRSAEERGSGPRCSCKSNCSTKRCGCQKSGSSCSENCSCSEYCQNKLVNNYDVQGVEESIGFNSTMVFAKNRGSNVPEVPAIASMDILESPVSPKLNETRTLSENTSDNSLSKKPRINFDLSDSTYN